MAKLFEGYSQSVRRLLQHMSKAMSLTSLNWMMTKFFIVWVRMGFQIDITQYYNTEIWITNGQVWVIWLEFMQYLGIFEKFQSEKRESIM